MVPKHSAAYCSVELSVKNINPQLSYLYIIVSINITLANDLLESLSHLPLPLSASSAVACAVVHINGDCGHSRDVNFVFFRKSIIVLKKLIFFRLSNLAVAHQ